MIFGILCLFLESNLFNMHQDAKRQASIKTSGRYLFPSRTLTVTDNVFQDDDIQARGIFINLASQPWITMDL